MRIALPVVILVAALTACDRDEMVGLEATFREREAELAELRAIAADFHEYRRKNEALDARLAESHAWLPDGVRVPSGIEVLGRIEKAVPGTSVSIEEARETGPRPDGSRDAGEAAVPLTIRLAGPQRPPRAAAALGALSAELPSLSLQSVELQENGWRAHARVLAARGEAPATGALAPSEAPAGSTRAANEGVFTSARVKDLRRRIERVDHEIAEIERTVGDVRRVVKAVKAKEAMLRAIEQLRLRADFSCRQGALLAALFAGEHPIAVSGRATFDGGKASLALDLNRGRTAADAISAVAAGCDLVRADRGADLRLDLSCR